MGIFSGLFKSRDKPENRTAGSAYTFYMGGTTSGKAVTERSAMQMTAVYACVRILSEAIAGLPLHMYRYKEDGGKEKAIDHPLYLLLHDEPNPEIELGFADGILTDEKCESAAAAEGYEFSASAVERSLVGKISGKAKVKPEKKPEGRPVDELRASLYKKLL